jgi:plasmid maintenance system antidote protein VapI
MLITEIIDSDRQLLDIVKSILLRAKAEGAKTVDVGQLINDIGDDSVTPELLVDILGRHGAELKNIIAGSTVDTIDMDIAAKKSMTTKADMTDKTMKNTALKQALSNLDDLT